MKLSERLLIIPLGVVTAILFVMVIHSRTNYVALQEKYRKLTKIIDDYRPTHRSEFKILRNLDDIDTKIVHRENKYQNLHNFTVYNPNFRLLTEWPPRFTISPVYPNIGKVLNKKIKSEMSSYDKFKLQISKNHIYEEENSRVVDDLLHDMNTLKIVAVEPYKKSKQLKFLVTFENGGKAIFLPQRFPRSGEIAVMENSFLDNAERHFSEIAAFHLDRILGFRRTPPTVGRRVNIATELYPLVDTQFRKTFLHSPEGKFCFHGKCKLYCDPLHAFCGNPDVIEGSLTASVVSGSVLDLEYIESPWRRAEENSYLRPSWEDDPYYCANEVRENYQEDEEKILFDILDAAIFDYLTGNLERENYYYHEVFANDSVGTFIHMENGKGFIDPNYDDPSIMSPVNQCCMVRLSTFNKLYSFQAGPRPLSDYMRWSLAKDPLAPLLTEAHFKALDRRVDILLDAFNSCVQANFPAAIFVDDMM